MEDNLISGNQAGMEITGGADSTFVQGNRIGTDADGVADLGNLGNGIYVADVSNTLIGGDTTANGTSSRATAPASS